MCLLRCTIVVSESTDEEDESGPVKPTDKRFYCCCCCSMLRLEHDLEHFSVSSQEKTSSSSPSNSPHSAPVSPIHDPTSSVDVSYREGSQRGFFEGLLGCLRPVWTILGKAAAAELKQQGQCVIKTPRLIKTLKALVLFPNVHIIISCHIKP